MQRLMPSRLPSLLCIVALAAFAGVACGPNTDNGGGSLTPEETTAEINALFLDSFCESAYQCPEEQDTGSLLIASRFETEEACKANIAAAFGPISAGPAESIAKDVERGLIEFDGKKAKECIDAFRRAVESDPCAGPFSPTFEEPEACEEAAQGTQEDGAPCDSDGHCVSGYCDTDADVGEDVCYGGQCAEAPTTELLAEGESCASPDAECDGSKDLVCDLDENGQSLVCVKAGSRAENEPCRSASACSPGLACSDEECVSLTLGAQGEACDLQTSVCQPGLICHVESFIIGELDASCEAPLDQGAECYFDVSCKKDLQCEGADLETGTSGTCDALLAAGGECSSALECEDGLACVDDECAVPEQEPYCEVPTE